ncbi:hypothetical protein CXG81DRAFT_24476 [Caulochytrium protostelioides]|uniref:Chitinase domain-containing protein 1 n=1 Tax=Caulochytrium protostelioides TaxID=1555241 RepID=A0A4P9XBU5_9FUNG|nr:hypothetical protein CXG81DRAFT_24476 [Caulochytrium protostelioides]|eukprot:RKP02876.1 hypothetical protein CXG81DRAFT_24476 [Caulochytrium protostelioides]
MAPPRQRPTGRTQDGDDHADTGAASPPPTTPPSARPRLKTSKPPAAARPSPAAAAARRPLGSLVVGGVAVLLLALSLLASQRWRHGAFRLGSHVPSVYERGLVTETPAVRAILQEHARTTWQRAAAPAAPEPSASGTATLVYVTPWNRRGSDVALRLAARRRRRPLEAADAHNATLLVAPTWFSVFSADAAQQRPEQDARLRATDRWSASRAYLATGFQDIDAGWVRTLQTPPAPARVVPRVLLTLASHHDLARLTANRDGAADDLAQLLATIVADHGFDGLVVEAPGCVVTFLNPLLAALRKRLHAQLYGSTKLIVVVVPALAAGSEATEDHEAALFIKPNEAAQAGAALASVPADFFAVMTYDYMPPWAWTMPPGAGPAGGGHVSGGGMPNAPRAWVEASLAHLLDDGQLAPSRVLLGMNLYGAAYPALEPAIVFREPLVGAAYLDMIARAPAGPLPPPPDASPDAAPISAEDAAGRLIWDARAEEHVMLIARADGTPYAVWYPTLYSLAQRMARVRAWGVGVALWEIGQGLDYFYEIVG